MFEFTNANHEDVVTWQPQSNVRMAMVFEKINAPGEGFVAAGRSLKRNRSKGKQSCKNDGYCMGSLHGRFARSFLWCKHIYTKRTFNKPNCMNIKMILPALTEAKSPFWRPIKYSLFPPLGLATLAAYCNEDDNISLQDEHVEELDIDDEPELVVIQVYITNAFRLIKLQIITGKKALMYALADFM